MSSEVKTMRMGEGEHATGILKQALRPDFKFLLSALIHSQWFLIPNISFTCKILARLTLRIQPRKIILARRFHGSLPRQNIARSQPCGQRRVILGGCGIHPHEFEVDNIV